MSLRAILAVFDHSPSTLANRLVLIALADAAHDDGSNAFPGVDTIAAKARVDRRTVQRALRALEDAGEIVSTGTTRHGTTIWQLECCTRGAASSAQGGGKLSPQGRQDAARTVLNQSGTTSGGKLSPLERARAYSERCARDRATEDARTHFEGNLGLEGADLEEAVRYHDERRRAR